jgi:hypothetical protein
VARRYESALDVALRAEDPVNARRAGAALRQVLGDVIVAIEAAGMENPRHRVLLAEMFLLSTTTMCRLLRRVPGIAEAAGPCGVRARHRSPTLLGLDTGGRNFTQTSFLGLHVASSRFMSDLSHSVFRDTFIESSDFTYGSLQHALLQRSCAWHSFFRHCSFADATFDEMIFIDCDLRGADFTTSPGSRQDTRLQFIGCDLRDTRWAGRDLTSSSFVDCRASELVVTRGWLANCVVSGAA